MPRLYGHDGSPLPCEICGRLHAKWLPEFRLMGMTGVVQGYTCPWCGWAAPRNLVLSTELVRAGRIPVLIDTEDWPLPEAA